MTLGVITGVIASRNLQIVDNTQFTFADGGVGALSLQFGAPSNSLFYSETPNASSGVSFGAPLNSLFYAENLPAVTGISFGAAPNTQFYSENSDASFNLILSASNFIQFFTQDETGSVPFQLGPVSNMFEPGAEELPSSQVPFQFAPVSQQELFFSLNDENRVIPFTFG